MRQLPVAQIQCPTAMRQPAHDHPVAPDDLHTVDTEVLARLVGTTGNHQPPGNQRTGIARPASLHRYPCQVDRLALHQALLARRALDRLRRHIQDPAEYGQLVPGIPHSLRRFRRLEL